jgi:hypothetical protein
MSSLFMKSYRIGNVSSQRVSIKRGNIHDRCSFGIMSQRERLQSYLHRRILFLNQQIDQRRAREVRERNEKRLRLVQRGRGTLPRKVISDYYQIKLNRTSRSRKF